MNIEEKTIIEKIFKNIIDNTIIETDNKINFNYYVYNKEIGRIKKLNKINSKKTNINLKGETVLLHIIDEKLLYIKYSDLIKDVYSKHKHTDFMNLGINYFKTKLNIDIERMNICGNITRTEK